MWGGERSKSGDGACVVRVPAASVVRVWRGGEEQKWRWCVRGVSASWERGESVAWRASREVLRERNNV